MEEHKHNEENELISLRLDKIKNKLKNNYGVISAILIAIIVWLSLSIRTLNVNNLKDTTTNNWTLAPDLDPYLFLRWAEYIAENGKLYAVDMLRNVPLGFNTSSESQLLSYMIAWFYKILLVLPASILKLLPGSPTEVTVTYAAIIFPVFMFGLTIIAFFFLAKEIFKNVFENKHYSTIIAIIACIFLAFSPSLLPRTIAGIPEKESAAFLFIFLSLYFMIISFNAKSYRNTLIYGAIAGIATGILGLIWGGITFILTAIGLSFLAAFFLGKIDKKRFSALVIWVVALSIIQLIFGTRFTIQGFFSSAANAPINFAILLSAIDLFVYNKIKDKKIISDMKNKFHLPREILVFIISALIVIVLLLAYTIIIDSNFVIEKISSLYTSLVSPFDMNRFSRTVAENRQPYFAGEWKNDFGPIIGAIPLFFWLFIIGSIALTYRMSKHLHKKDKILLTSGFAVSILAMIFSRYSSTSVLNGENLSSSIVYFGGLIFFALIVLKIIYKYNKSNEKEKLDFDYNLIIAISFLFISILAARSGVRFLMVLVPMASIMASYLIMLVSANALKYKDDKKIFSVVLAIMVVLLSIYVANYFYQVSKAQAEGFYPSTYNIQWQNAMKWVRDNTPENAVFAHWWDYGYWLQSLGNRATILDGGNAIVYWNHLMGRHVLTGTNDTTALEFLKTHKATHLLIDSTDIGKYSAYSSIGGDENADRISYIPSFYMDKSQTQETKTGLTHVYAGGTNLDQDVIFEINGSSTRLAKENSVLGAIIIEEDKTGKLGQPKAVFMQQNRQIQIPLRYLYYNNELIDFGGGLEAGFFIYQTITPQQNSLDINDRGVGYYLSSRTINSMVARKYLFNEEGSFELVHTEPHPIVTNLRSQGINASEFIDVQGSFFGPIKIWEINYPANIEENPEFLLTDYPDERLR